MFVKMKKILLIFCLGQLALCTPKASFAQINFSGFDGGWSYRNAFDKKFNNAYHIDWLLVGTFTYKSAKVEATLHFPTSKWGTKIPYYSARLTFPLYKTNK